MSMSYLKDKSKEKCRRISRRRSSTVTFLNDFRAPLDKSVWINAVWLQDGNTSIVTIINDVIF